jgi:2-polyprenyl-6-methoxyphenol hydroxylase-like FAD-dependent oxidoreductase
VTWDLAVIGAGPCGAAAAMTAQRAGFRTLAIDDTDDVPGRAARAHPPRHFVELAPPFLRDALDRCGYDGRALLAPHPTSGGVWSWWGQGPQLLPALLDPHGPGTLIDRTRFDADLRAGLAARGVTPVVDRAQHLARGRGNWTLGLASGRSLQARRVLIATGRAGAGLVPNSPWRQFDRLVAVGLSWDVASAAAGALRVVADRDGWWYGARAAGGRFTAAYLTDADLLPRDWKATIPSAVPPWLVPPAERRDAGAPIDVRVLPAATRARSSAAMAGLAFAGDARLSLDPLSGAGLLRAIEDGARVARYLLADPGFFARRAFRRQHCAEVAELLAERARQYAGSPQSGGPFWERRRGPGRDFTRARAALWGSGPAASDRS